MFFPPQAKLQDFIDAANSGDNSHLVVIPAGILPSDVLISSPIIAGEGGGMGSFGAPSAGGGAAEFGGVDPNLDPELAMALRVSMEEERARQEAAAAASSEGHAETKSSDAMDVDPSTSPTTAPKTPLAPAVAAGDDEEALLRQALAMSMNESAAVPEGMDPEEYEAMQVRGGAPSKELCRRFVRACTVNSS
jgi:26S proteasome regulatory subunit N10